MFHAVQLGAGRTAPWSTRLQALVPAMALYLGFLVGMEAVGLELIAFAVAPVVVFATIVFTDRYHYGNAMRFHDAVWSTAVETDSTVMGETFASIDYHLNYVSELPLAERRDMWSRAAVAFSAIRDKTADSYSTAEGIESHIAAEEFLDAMLGDLVNHDEVSDDVLNEYAQYNDRWATVG